MGKLRIFHPELGGQFTRLASDVAAAATSSTVENNNGFAANDLAVWGALGEEKSEIVTVTSVSGTTTIGHTGALTFAHGAQTRISQIKYNQAEIYRATAEGGSYSLIATADLDIDEVYTIYDDTSGSSSSWYKIRYKNSVASTFSDYSPEVQSTGYEEDSLFSMTEEVLADFNDTDGVQVSRTQVRRYLRTATRKLVMRMIQMMPDYRRQRTTQTFTSGTNTYNNPTRFLAFIKIAVASSGSTESDAYEAEFRSEGEIESSAVYSGSNPVISFRGEQWVVRPTPTGGTAFLYYYDYPAVMTDDSDEHGLPFGARDALVSYALYKCWVNKNNEMSDQYKADWKSDGDEWIEFVAQSRQLSTNKSVQVIFGDDLYE